MNHMFTFGIFCCCLLIFSIFTVFAYTPHIGSRLFDEIVTNCKDYFDWQSSFNINEDDAKPHHASIKFNQIYGYARLCHVCYVANRTPRKQMAAIVWHSCHANTVPIVHSISTLEWLGFGFGCCVPDQMIHRMECLWGIGKLCCGLRYGYHYECDLFGQNFSGPLAVCVYV